MREQPSPRHPNQALPRAPDWAPAPSIDSDRPAHAQPVITDTTQALLIGLTLGTAAGTTATTIAAVLQSSRSRRRYYRALHRIDLGHRQLIASAGRPLPRRLPAAPRRPLRSSQLPQGPDTARYPSIVSTGFWKAET